MCTNSVLIGLGNLYKTEMCFLLGVSPWAPVRGVDPGVVVALGRRLLLANAERPEQSTTGDLARGDSTGCLSGEGGCAVAVSNE